MLEDKYRTANRIYEKLKSEVALLEESLEDISFGLYEPHFEFDTAEDYKVELKATRDRQRELIRSGDATDSPGTWTINGSRTEGKKMERQYTKVMLRAFNGECDAAVAKVSWNNASKMEQRVEKAFGDINKLGAVMNMSISPTYLEARLDERSSPNFPVKSPFGSPGSVKLLVPPTCFWGGTRFEVPRFS